MENKIEFIANKKGYTISKEGVLYNPKGKQIGYYNVGYLRACIKINKKQCNFYAHRLQAFQKYGASLYKEGIVVRHLNNNSKDNSWDNIAIGTSFDNMADMPKQVRIDKAIHASSFIKKYDYLPIKNFYAKEKSYIKTMKEFNISSRGTLFHILHSIY